MDAGCEGDAGHGLAGYIYTARKVNTTPLYRCPNGTEMDFAFSSCAGGTLLGYAVDALANLPPQQPGVCAGGQGLRLRHATLKTVTAVSYTVNSLNSYFVRPISETLTDANGTVLNRAWIDYDGGQGYTYAANATDGLIFGSGPVYLRDFGLRWLIPIQGNLTRGQATRVQAGIDGANAYVTAERYQYDANW
ncbi:MAG: hypothetical protein HC853_06385 [Anaerolineae bacterium]|nr:hypothetical protein [Anaerolineae bacterium]